MKVKFSGSNIILSAESDQEARVLQAARANSERKEKMRCSRIWVGDVDSETKHPALTLTLEKLRPVGCDLDRQHAIAQPVSFPALSTACAQTTAVANSNPSSKIANLAKLASWPPWLAGLWPLRGRGEGHS